MTATKLKLQAGVSYTITIPLAGYYNAVLQDGNRVLMTKLVEGLNLLMERMGNTERFAMEVRTPSPDRMDGGDVAWLIIRVDKPEEVTRL